MRRIQTELLRNGFDIIGRPEGLPPGEVECSIYGKDGVTVWLGSCRSEINFDVVQASGYSLPVIDVLKNLSLLPNSASIIIECEAARVIRSGQVKEFEIARLLKDEWHKIFVALQAIS